MGCRGGCGGGVGCSRVRVLGRLNCGGGGSRVDVGEVRDGGGN